jgi:hypothetical protein
MSNQNNANSPQESSTTQSHIGPAVIRPNNEPSGSNPSNRVSDQHRAVLTACDSIVNQYRKGEISKAFAYASIQKRVYEADGVSPSHAEEGFQSFIEAIENHDTEVYDAQERGKSSRGKRRAATPESDPGYEFDDEEDRVKKPKVDEGEFPWTKAGTISRTKLSPS